MSALTLPYYVDGGAFCNVPPSYKTCESVSRYERSQVRIFSRVPGGPLSGHFHLRGRG